MIQADPSIGPRKKQEWCSAIRVYCKWTEKAPEYVPVDHRAAARRFAGLSFLVCGVSEGRFNNVKSIVIRVFRGNRANLIETRVVRLLPVWARLLDETDDPWLGLQCGRFFRWCSAKGILPCQVIQASADQFALDLEELMPTHRSRKAFVTMCRGWNKAASKRSDLWPPVRLDPGDKRRFYRTPWSQVEPGYRADVERMLTAFSSKLDLVDVFLGRTGRAQ